MDIQKLEAPKMVALQDGLKAYWAKVAFRNPQHQISTEEKGYNCMCCKDAGILSYATVLRYIDDEEYQDIGLMTAAPAYLCSRTGCKGNETEIDVPDPDGGGSTKRKVDRFKRDGLNQSLSPENCLSIHNQERERMRCQNEGLDLPVVAKIEVNNSSGTDEDSGKVLEFKPKPKIKKGDDKQKADYSDNHWGF